MSYSYDLATDRGKVRLQIPDHDETALIFQDEEIDAFLAIEGSVAGALAGALETIASSEALTLKVIQLLDVRTDGAKLAAELRARAAAIRDRIGAADTAAFAVAELVYDDFGFAEHLRNVALRELP